jgi:hypothetical protein
MNFSKVVDYDPRKIGKIDTTFNLNDNLPKGNDFDLYPITGSGELRMFNKNNVSIYSTKVYSKQTDPKIKIKIRNNSIKYRKALIEAYKSKMENKLQLKEMIEEKVKIDKIIYSIHIRKSSVITVKNIKSEKIKFEKADKIYTIETLYGKKSKKDLEQNDLEFDEDDLEQKDLEFDEDYLESDD